MAHRKTPSSHPNAATARSPAARAAALLGMLALGTAAVFMASPAHAQSSEAQVKKVDKAQGKVTLAHGEIRNLGMPPMTMVFRVADKALLDKVTEGSRIKFDADKVDGQYTVTKLTVVP